MGRTGYELAGLLSGSKCRYDEVWVGGDLDGLYHTLWEAEAAPSNPRGPGGPEVRHWQKLAMLLLAAACSGDATAPDPATVEPEPPTPPANRAPVATADSIPAVHLPGPGEAVAVAVGAYFTDPDGDALTFAAASTDTAVVLAAVAGDTVRLTGGGTGGAGTVTVTAADPSGLSARAAVAVAVNRTPVLSGEMPAQSLMAGDAPAATDVSGYFDDPDGDTLAFEASSTDTAVVRVALSGTALTFEARAVGEVAVTVTASDPDSLEARAVFTVEVTENPDRAALAALYEATDGPNWTNNENWLTDAPLCEWYGVGTTRTYRGGELVGCGRWVGGLDLRDNALTGAIPPALGNLDSLEYLHLGGNALTGAIPPELGDLDSLEYLFLGGNALTGAIPPELGDLASLEQLSLYRNAALTGPIPPELGDLTSLTSLDLFNNALTGPIPPELGNLASLEHLSLGGNALTGAIPPELGNLVGLEYLWLGDNTLTGAIPPELGNLASLESLNLARNNTLTGAIPPELGNLASLELLFLDENALTGAIPPELSNLASLRTLWLGDNALSGAIPPELGNLASLELLFLNQNALTGAIPPELGNLASLESLWLQRNALTGAIPPELGNLASLQGLLLSQNALSGPIPSELMNLASLESLTLRGNPELCAPADPQLRAWLIERRLYPFACRSDPDVRLLPLALMRADGNGVSLPLPDDLSNPAVNISDPGVVAATVAGGWLILEPRSIGRADVELVPSGGGSPAVAGVAVREAVGTFGIDIVMEQPAALAFEETMVAAADWWSAVLDGTEWEDRRPGCFNDEATALADELLIHAAIDAETGYTGGAASCFFPAPEEDSTAYEPAGGKVWIGLVFAGHKHLARHEIGHILGLVKWPSRSGLTTKDRAHFTGLRAVEAYRAGGGDPELPGVPLQEDGCRCHWGLPELMGPHGGVRDALSLAALADAGYTVDMSKATPWRKQGNAAAAVAGEPFRERVEVRVLPRPVPE